MNSFIVAMARTPVGVKNGVLAEVHAVDLLAAPLRRVASLVSLTNAAVVVGCATPIGEQGMNVAHAAALAAGIELTAPAVTVDGDGSSGMAALTHAVALVRSGAADVAVAGAVASASRVPPGATAGIAVGKPFGPAVHVAAEAEGGLVPPGERAERLADRHGLNRSALDDYASESGRRTLTALIASKPYRVPMEVGKGRSVRWIEDDERVSRGAPLFAPADFVPAYSADGKITAGNSAGPSDGAVALVVMSETALARHGGLTALARIGVTASQTGSLFEAGSGVELLKGLDVPKDTCYVVHEDTAVTPLAFRDATGFEVNAHGGGLTVGDPLGAGSLMTVLETVADLREPTVIVSAGASPQHAVVTVFPN